MSLTLKVDVQNEPEGSGKGTLWSDLAPTQ